MSHCDMCLLIYGREKANKWLLQKQQFHSSLVMSKLDVTIRYKMHALEKSKEGNDYLCDGSREMDKEKCKMLDYQKDINNDTTKQ